MRNATAGHAVQLKFFQTLFKEAWDELLCTIRRAFRDILAAGAVKAGKARALAINLERRSSHLPDVPTYKEAGMEIPLVTTFGLYAPARTPKDIIQRVNLELANGLINNLEMRRKLITAAGVEIEPPAGGSPEEFAAYLLAERKRGAGIVKTANIKRE